MISRQQIEKIALLARLKIEESEMDHFTAQFNQILGFIEKLNQLETTGVEPTSHSSKFENVLREDEVIPFKLQPQVFEEAPEEEGQFFKVPKVIG